MSDYHDEEEFESLEEYRERENADSDEIDGDWSDSLDDMESGDWSEQFDRGGRELEDVDDPDDFGDDEVDDYDLERIERDYFDGDPRETGRRDAPVRPTGAARSKAKPGSPPTGKGEDLIDRYVEVKTRLQELRRELRDLKPRVIEAIQDAGGAHDERLGRVKVAKRPQWKYSDEVARLQEAIKDKKKEEREAGVAVVAEETSYLLVRPEAGQRET